MPRHFACFWAPRLERFYGSDIIESSRQVFNVHFQIHKLKVDVCNAKNQLKCSYSTDKWCSFHCLNFTLVSL